MAIGDRLADAAANLNAATGKFLADVRAFDVGCGWYCDGWTSCRDWLKWRLGLSAGTAREYVRVATRLGELELVDGALQRGEISYCKARAITRAATAQTESYLVECAAHMTGSQLETLCSKLRSVGAPLVEATSRSIAKRETDDGMVRITITLRPEEAATIFSVIDSVAKRRIAPCREPDTGDDRAAASAEASKPVPRGFDRVDALMEIVEAVARGEAVQRVPTELVVAIGAEALAGGDVEDIEKVGVTRDGAALSMAVVRKLACDCGVVAVVEDGAGNPLKVGRKYRTVSGAIKRALAKRDPTCQFPGCDHRAFLAGHHIDHWLDGGPTDLENLVNLCTAHHAIVHEQDLDIVLSADRPPEFRDRWGRLLAATPTLRSTRDLEPSERAVRCEIDGGPVDYGLIVAEALREPSR